MISTDPREADRQLRDRSSDRKAARDAAERLKNVTNCSRLTAQLTQDELDWLYLLQERLFEIGNRPMTDEDGEVR